MKYQNHKLQTNPRHREEEPQDIYSNKTSERQKRKATSSLFLFKMIARLERTQSNVYQNKDQHRTPTNNGRYIKQLSNNNRTTAFEQTTALAAGGCGMGGGVIVFYWRQIFVVDSVFVNAHNLLSSHEGFLTNAMHHHRE